ncbi:hypothetical protein OF83DRAFT_1284243 [Amylostereum chailletii]|nr:hypothetical protein OF83DRAFT_1284243 [Amylostereum chailletii]
MVAVLATNDLYRKNKTYQTVVENLVRTYPPGAHPLYFLSATVYVLLHSELPVAFVYVLTGVSQVNRDPTFWGLSCYYAYRAYGEVSFLNTAIQIWNQTFPYWISEAEATAGTTPVRNVSIAPGPQCTPVPASTVAAGAVLTNFGNTTTDTSADAPAVGAFMVLSAYLYEESKNSKYLDAATLSATFINNTLYQSGVVVNGYNLVTCVADESLIESHYSGLFVEGLAIIVNVTGDETWSEHLNTVVASTVKTTQWTRADGVITEDLPNGNSIYSASKGIFIRGLHEARVRSDPGSAMALLIDSYTNVQINAILGVANKDGPNYPSNWATPPTSVTTTYGGTIAALDVFNSALDAADPPSGSSTSVPISTSTVSSTASTAFPSRPGPSPVGAIAGGVVGGVVGTIGVTLLVVYCLRRRRRRDTLELGARSRETQDTSVDPFIQDPTFRAPFRAPLAWISPSKSALLQRDIERRRRANAPESSAATSSVRVPDVSESGVTLTSMLNTADAGRREDSGPLNYSSMLLRELIMLLRQRSDRPPTHDPSRSSHII